MAASEMVRVCFDRVVPERLADRARRAALAENDANASPFEAAAIRSKLWRPGRVLRVSFLNGSAGARQKVAHHASRWVEHANIVLDFGDHAQADIRVSFEGVGSWSAIGTDALVEEMFPPGQPTMNFGWLRAESSEEECSRVVLHEFGHALGMVHEHQSPAGGISWNREAVIADLSGPPNRWDLSTIERNMFQRYEATLTQFTRFDPESIMLYAIPAHWTRDGWPYAENSELSALDKEFVRARYPGEA